MNDPDMALSLLVMLVGGLIVLAILVKALSERVNVPALVGYLAIGFCVRLLDDRFDMLHEEEFGVFEFLARIGLIALLFRVGLESNLKELLKQLRSASLIWVGNVALSGLAGYSACRYLLGLEFLPSLVVGTAMTATSVGIPVAIWRQEKALDSEDGRRFIDVAELDDITGVLAMALLFSLIPVLRSGDEGALWLGVAKTVGYFGSALAIFAAGCLLFSHFIEERLTRFLEEIQCQRDLTIVVAGLGFIIAAGASLAGFSAAIGAFFAGLVFSRDPERVRIDAGFDSLYALFTPFFFINIGMTLAPDSLGAALIPGLILITAAVFGKVLGTGVPALACGFSSAALLAVSMVPRAEITMVIMKRGHQMGPDVVPDGVFAGMVLVSAVTCALAPLLLQAMLRKEMKGEASS
ncbi:MAG: cation:proton antiporter [Candidatus Hydrogenedentota bacterium]